MAKKREAMPDLNEYSNLIRGRCRVADGTLIGEELVIYMYVYMCVYFYLPRIGD